MVNNGNSLYEQVIHPDEGIVFVTYDKKREEFRFVDSVEDGALTVYPIEDDEQIINGAIRLPQYPDIYGSVEELVGEICDHIKKYVDVSEDFLTFTAYYILLSWVYDRVDTLPYMRVRGDTGCGKSRYLDVAGGLCYKPMMMAGAVTPAPIYRMISRWGGTAIIDEGDFKDSDEKNEVVKILNCGFERNRPVIRCAQDNVDKLLTLTTFCPKILATRFDFKDKALESRCITEIMKKTSREDVPILLTKAFHEEQRVLRNKLLAFRFHWRDKIDTDNIEKVNLGKIDARIKQAAASFTLLFSNIDALMDQFRGFLARYNDELIEERADSYDGALVNAYLELGASGEGIINSSKVAEKVKEMYGMDTTSRTVGRHLKSLGLDVTPRKIDGKTYRILECNVTLAENLINQYVPAKSDLFEKVKEVTEVTKVTTHIGARQNLIFSQATLSPYSNVTDVTDKTHATPQTPLGKATEILKIYDELSHEEKRPIPESKILDMVSFSRTDAEDTIEKMIREGDRLFRPHPGEVQRI